MSGAGLTLPPAGGRVSGETVAFAAGRPDRSGKGPGHRGRAGQADRAAPPAAGARRACVPGLG
jgi:hypothetical protein